MRLFRLPKALQLSFTLVSTLYRDWADLTITQRLSPPSDEAIIIKSQTPKCFLSYEQQAYSNLFPNSFWTCLHLLSHEVPPGHFYLHAKSFFNILFCNISFIWSNCLVFSPLRVVVLSALAEKNIAFLGFCESLCIFFFFLEFSSDLSHPRKSKAPSTLIVIICPGPN